MADAWDHANEADVALQDQTSRTHGAHVQGHQQCSAERASVPLSHRCLQYRNAALHNLLILHLHSVLPYQCKCVVAKPAHTLESEVACLFTTMWG